MKDFKILIGYVFKNASLRILSGVLSAAKAPHMLRMYDTLPPTPRRSSSWLALLKRVQIFTVLLLIILLIGAGGVVWGQSVEAAGAAQTESISTRPMRGRAPDAVLLAANRALHTSHYTPPVRAENSLITDTALEQELTQRYIKQYSTAHGAATLNAILERARPYLPFIKEEVERLKMPPELALLPVIESGFSITAKSKSGAVGLWQFMLNSISPFNIKVTDLIDERRDFVKSTKGALLKLEENYRTLGSWELALAAYNSGLGAVSRVIQKTGRQDYWELVRRNDLRQETVHFVPKLIAAAYIISQPRKYGINVWQEKIEWESIALTRQISIDMLAEKTGVSKSLLRNLNAELLHGITPADKNYRLKVPADSLEEITAVLERDDLELIRYLYHVVRHGDTLWSMSRSYNTSVNMIEQHNPGIAERYLKIGETVVIPVLKAPILE
ncbi:MAG: transglycosylase SLT domain-containing protein [Treponema sp.]|nr:transglycosylase SLT domain-containing protein [Treponema sp.]